jgi:hypothetical protein
MKRRVVMCTDHHVVVVIIMWARKLSRYGLNGPEIEFRWG